MPDLAQSLALSQQLLDTRDIARRLFGANYAEKVEPWRVFVRKACATWKCSPLEVAPHLERENAMPDNPLLLFAAVVDVAAEARVP